MARKIEGNKKNLTLKFSKAASTNSGRVHVVPSKDGWSVKKEGAKRSSSVSPTKEEAIKAAKTVKSAERIVIHKKDGTIQRNTKR
jgi:thiamine pyrophosphate-dependent acetolactate synthase large subunit-like protein